MKTRADEIRNAWALSVSPLVVQIVYTCGAMDSFTLTQMARDLTPGARAKVSKIIEAKPPFLS